MTEEPQPGLRSSLRQLGATVLGIVHTRLALAGVELEEELRRVVDMLVLALALAVLAGIGLLVLTLTIVVVFWDGYRLVALGGLTVLYLGLAVWCGLRLRDALAARPPMFAATMHELEKDRAALQGSDAAARMANHGGL